jgi:hypothetical protein
MFIATEMWQKVAKFKGAEYFRKALYLCIDFKKGIDVYAKVHIGATTVLFFANALVKSPIWRCRL